MKKLLLILALFVCVTQLNAQSEWDRSFLGIKAGINIANNNFSNPTLTDVEANYKTGFAGGLYCNIALSDKFSLQPELLYSAMGTKLKSTIPDQVSEFTLKLNYVSIPVLVKFYATPNLAIFVGPQFDFLASESAEGDGEVNSLDGSDIAGTAGLEYWFNNNIGIYGRYNYGFQNINDKYYGLSFNSTAINSEVQNAAIQVGLTIGFKSKREAVVGSSQPGSAPATAAKDGDGDGVSDKDDKCPNTPGIAGNLGCPELIIYFERDEAGLTDDDKSNLNKVVTFLNNNPGLSITVEGHSSTPGGPALNQTLSEQRAAEAVDYLVEQGIARNRMQVTGFGEQFPVGDNKTEEGRAKSRRVVMKIAN